MLGDIYDDGALRESREWIEWLVNIGYPFDVTFDSFPPCNLWQLAEAWRDKEAPDEDILSWADTLEAETGEWPLDKRR